MVGGGGEKKTLRLVAQYADACNVFGARNAIHRNYAILRDHCGTLGRNPDEIERSTLQTIDLRADSPTAIVDRFGELGDAGAQHVIASLRDVHDLANIETVGRDIIPALRAV